MDWENCHLSAFSESQYNLLLIYNKYELIHHYTMYCILRRNAPVEDKAKAP
jgi:hypothetical protein